jgi:glucosylceramidase
LLRWNRSTFKADRSGASAKHLGRGKLGIAAVGFVMFLWVLAAVPSGGADKAPTAVREWLTTADKTSLLAEQAPIAFGGATGTVPVIEIDDSKTFQTMDGFGQAVTGGSAQLLVRMSPAARVSLLHELFGNGPTEIGTSYIRVSVGASDMNDHVYTYDDMTGGQNDPELRHFSLEPDRNSVIPVLQQILAIQPKIKILASPWTAPAWMKTNVGVKGGSLKKEFYGAYAEYWVRYLGGMADAGIPIDALTPQNEPENDKNTPSMLMTAEEQADFIGHYLGPALARAGLHTKIISFDHNCDHPNYPIAILRDPAAAKYANGSGFHLYVGEISALSTVHDAFPGTSIYFTEQLVLPRKEDPVFDIAEPVARLIVGAPLNWSRNVLLWNLAADPQNGPHTNEGGCPICSGAITIDGDTVTRNLAYYVAAHASKFVPPGSVRIGMGPASGSADSLPHVAFRTPEHHHVLIVSNTGNQTTSFAIRFHGHEAIAKLPADAAATYVW